MGGLRIDVAHAGPERLSGLAPVFGRAFVTEPMMLWPMGEHGDVVDRFTRCFASFLNAAADAGVVWEAGDAQGAAVWVPPDRSPPWEQHPWNQPQITALTNDAGHRYDTFWTWVDFHSPDEPLWQLDSIAVEPAVQGHGIGTALITAGLDQARADGLGAFLSTGTPGNVSVYQRCGFRVIEDLDAPGGGPHIWFMRSDP
ncbi:MAG: GNAT family N-acetyltransferase [Actinomycetota bacterium]|nr:GNAT family N-acetyltransferase [Actinomycetota bacterium]